MVVEQPLPIGKAVDVDNLRVAFLGHLAVPAQFEPAAGAADDLHEALGKMPEDHSLYPVAREQDDVVRSQLRTH